MKHRIESQEAMERSRPGSREPGDDHRRIQIAARTGVADETQTIDQSLTDHAAEGDDAERGETGQLFESRQKGTQTSTKVRVAPIPHSGPAFGRGDQLRGAAKALTGRGRAERSQRPIDEPPQTG